MTLSSLSIRDCRNLQSVDIALSAGLNLFIGPNGAGKTALLEAVHILSRGKSFRSSHTGPVIRSGQQELIVRAGFSGIPRDSDSPARQVAVSRPRRGATRVHIDGEPASGGISAVSKLLPVQVMLPSVSDLVFGGPAERRRWLDWGVFHVKPSYLFAWRRYTKVLKQRNALLKQPISADDAALASFTEQLVQAAVPLAEYRRSYTANWTPMFLQVLGALDPELADLGLSLCDFGSMDERQESGSLLERIRELVSENRLRDVKSGVTHRGPHRMDLVLRVGDKRAGEVLSRGQGKSVALAMMVSQAQYLAATTGQNSLFLIDDAGAELDRSHNAAFFEALAATKAQILATSTEEPWTGGAYTGTNRAVFHVKQGRIVPSG